MQTTPCHCGAVSITIPDLPGRRPTANFSICRLDGAGTGECIDRAGGRSFDLTRATS